MLIRRIHRATLSCRPAAASFIFSAMARRTAAARSLSRASISCRMRMFSSPWMSPCSPNCARSSAKICSMSSANTSSSTSHMDSMTIGPMSPSAFSSSYMRCSCLRFLYRLKNAWIFAMATNLRSHSCTPRKWKSAYAASAIAPILSVRVRCLRYLLTAAIPMADSRWASDMASSAVSVSATRSTKLPRRAPKIFVLRLAKPKRFCFSCSSTLKDTDLMPVMGSTLGSSRIPGTCGVRPWR
mmetsp:Transcript_13819/g.43747  ORF Transcript_13819/g.43747 Transcript_13819/m.43747 type:complete len:241 (-) Transcript_13819:650-1372(-)